MAWLVTVGFIVDDKSSILTNEAVIDKEWTDLGSNYFCIDCGAQLTSLEIATVLRRAVDVSSINNWKCSRCIDDDSKS